MVELRIEVDLPDRDDAHAERGGRGVGAAAGALERDPCGLLAGGGAVGDLELRAADARAAERPEDPAELDQERRAGAQLYGRRLYELKAGYWPTAGDDPEAPAPVIEIARIWSAMPKVVFSKTLERVEWNSRLVAGDAAEEVARLELLHTRRFSSGVVYVAYRLA